MFPRLMEGMTINSLQCGMKLWWDSFPFVYAGDSGTRVSISP